METCEKTNDIVGKIKQILIKFSNDKFTGDVNFRLKLNEGGIQKANVSVDEKIK